jgi:hypothetical protein
MSSKSITLPTFEKDDIEEARKLSMVNPMRHSYYNSGKIEVQEVDKENEDEADWIVPHRIKFIESLLSNKVIYHFKKVSLGQGALEKDLDEAMLKKEDGEKSLE